MTTRRRRVLAGAVLVALALAAWPAQRAWEILEIGAAVKAKVVCSGVFVSGREAADVTARDLLPELELLSSRVDREAGTVTASGLGGLVRRTAVHRQGLGCTLAVDMPPEALREQVEGLRMPAAIQTPWPEPELAADEGAVDRERLRRAVEAAFAEPHPDMRRDTRAILVVHRGAIVAERYGPGFDADTPQLGWSMTKSLLNALVGIRVRQGVLALDAPPPVPEWAPGDPRTGITLDQLLRMSSGLRFEEVYSDLRSDVVVMLFDSSDAGAAAAARPLAAQPDTVWSYSSGTSNLLSRALRATFEDHHEYLRFPRRELFARVGMTSAVIEPDPSGTFVASSFSYATARDWARFGLLYLNDGVWNGERILPEGWVEYSTTPTPEAPEGRYGAHWWLNAGDPHDPERRSWPSAPPETFWASGFDGQYVFVIPSRQLVVVRLGRTPDERAWDPDDFLAELLATLP